MESRKIVQTNLFTGHEWSRDVENRCVDLARGREVGKMHWEIRTDTFTLPCMKQTACGKLLYSTGGSAQCSAMT